MAEAIAARGRPYRKPTVYDTFAAAFEYNLREEIGLVRTPLLITDPDEESFWPGQSKEMYEQLMVTGRLFAPHERTEPTGIASQCYVWTLNRMLTIPLRPVLSG